MYLILNLDSSHPVDDMIFYQNGKYNNMYGADIPSDLPISVIDTNDDGIKVVKFEDLVTNLSSLVAVDSDMDDTDGIQAYTVYKISEIGYKVSKLFDFVAFYDYNIDPDGYKSHKLISHYKNKDSVHFHKLTCLDILNQYKEAENYDNFKYMSNFSSKALEAYEYLKYLVCSSSKSVRDCVFDYVHTALINDWENIVFKGGLLYILFSGEHTLYEYSDVVSYSFCIFKPKIGVNIDAEIAKLILLND